MTSLEQVERSGVKMEQDLMDNVVADYNANVLELAEGKIGLIRSERREISKMAQDIALEQFPALRREVGQYIHARSSSDHGRITTETAKKFPSAHRFLCRLGGVWQTMNNADSKDARQKPLPAKSNGTNINGMKENTIVRLVIDWVLDGNDFIPKSKLLHYFVKRGTARAFDHGRHYLAEQGYEIEAVEHGWMVTSRPVQEDLKLKQLEAQLANLSEEIRQHMKDR